MAARRPPAGRRFGRLPRSAPVLAVMLAAAAAALVWIQGRERGTAAAAGGPLFSLAPPQIQGLLITFGGAQYRLDRTPGGVWTLGGGVSDFVDQGAMANLLADLAAARGGPLLPGTEPQDGRYEFSGPQALRLVLLGEGRRREDLALGTANPVTGAFYASGAGRPACFTVPAALRERLAGLPDAVRTRTLLPPLEPQDLTAIRWERGGRERLLRRRDGRWWLLQPADWPQLPAGVARDYQEWYADRRLVDDQGTWHLAQDEAVGLLVYEVSRVVVRDFPSPRAQEQLRVLAGLDDPLWRITLEGAGIDPDPGDASADRLTLAFGPAVEAGLVPVVRRGNVLLADQEAGGGGELAAQSLLHAGALTRRAVFADTVRVWREGRLVLAGARSPGPPQGDGRRQWSTTVPAPGAAGPDEHRRRAQAGEFVVDLDRIPILRVLPPTSAPGVLEDRDRVTIELTFTSQTGPTVETFAVGYLAAPDPDRAPRGGGDGAAAMAEEAVGLWRPATGQLLQVQTSLPVTVRNLAGG